MENEMYLLSAGLVWGSILMFIAFVNLTKCIKVVTYLGIWLLLLVPITMFILWRFDNQWN